MCLRRAEHCLPTNLRDCLDDLCASAVEVDASDSQRSKFAEGFQAMSGGQKDTGKFRAELQALPREEWPSHIRRLVSDQISLLLRRSIDPDRPLSDYGLDSLGNLELLCAC